MMASVGSQATIFGRAALPAGALPAGALPAPPVASHKQTVIGVAFAPPTAQQSLAPAHAPVPAPAPALAPAPTPVQVSPPVTQAPDVSDKKKTMLGVAMPGIAPVRSSVPPAPEPFHKGPSNTMLGVAMPGIAPVQTGHGTPAYVPPPISHRKPLPAVVPRPAPLVDDEPAVGPMPRLRRRGVPLAFVAGAVLALVVGFGAAVAFLWRGQSLLVTPRLDAQGHDQLHLLCDSCPDDTTATLDSAKAVFRSKEADLTLGMPLDVGDNALSIWLDRPRLGRDEAVKVVVPIAFRIGADLSSLAQAHPTVIVRVQAVKGTIVRVADKLVSLDATGKGAFELDVSSQTQGWSDDVRLVDQAIPYAITTTTDPTKLPSEQRGSLAVRAGIASLHLDAPGLTAVIEAAKFRLVGRTVKGATLTANGQTVPVDADGAFARAIDAPALGDLPVEVRADGPQMASRTARFTVKRVASLADEAKARERAPWLGFDQMLSGDGVGKATVVEGDVVEQRATTSQVIALVDDQRGCDRKSSDACLVRVVYGGDVPIAAGDHVRVFGKLSSVTKPSDTRPLPVVQADFVVQGRPGRR
jgi:hypothetical protein